MALKELTVVASKGWETGTIGVRKKMSGIYVHM